MKGPKYLYIEPQATLTGAGILVSTQAPFMWARVWKWKTGEEDRMGQFLANNNGLPVYTIPGFRIVLTFAGCWMEGQKLSNDQIGDHLEGMGEYYFTEKLDGKEKLKFLYGNRS